MEEGKEENGERRKKTRPDLTLKNETVLEEPIEDELIVPLR
jgi:hypothetical protein